MNYDRSIATEGAIPAMHDRVADSDLSEFGTPEDDGGRKKRRIVIIIVAAAVLAAVVAFLIWQSSAAPEQSEAQVPIVTVAIPGNTNVAGEITATGTLGARRPMPIGSVGEGGSVSDVLVDAGDWVRAGQVLAVIDRSVQSQQAEAQAAQVQVARADAELAQANLDRALKLVDRGFISTADVDRLTATRDAAEARVRVAQATLGELRARNARLSIVAPAGGLVLERNVERGQVVGAGGTPLFVLARGGEMELNARVSESDLARLAVGVPAEVRPVGSQEVFTGQVWQLAPTIDEASRQGIARIAMPYDKALRPGGFATASIRSGSVTAPILPESAIMSDDEGSFVYVVGSDNTVARQRVELGVVTAQGITIASGLTGRERVVLRAGGFLSPGDPVKPVTADSDG
ncbi:efflux RND transporter periplasmic adaptor subunit [Croceicoccus marinus]|uniref:Efflux RND transporter periplasmic adaptor subunit n=1 Tax=Croceicoccus marinus TaxID=450378 RepID=A0A7G6VUX1_9SPHN|nr:efflux RND transporter periplasmic adaptor subunit [Croceicoccus marinus]QNE05536.1 efflux RND transporter periplasmic adaptor subunit [Croceicoccus marinus]